MDVVVIGAAHWDVVARAAAPLAAGADVPGRVVRRVGGVAANVALGLARAAGRCGCDRRSGTMPRARRSSRRWWRAGSRRSRGSARERRMPTW
jgi:sugar/nucleoside kinase (ribokinase family)